MNRPMVSRGKPPPVARPPSRATSSMAIHMASRAMATAVSAVTGSGSRWPLGMAKVMTPVIVPGLAAKMISGASHRVSPSFAGLSVAALPASIENPIHDSTPPPATEEASRDTPKRCRMRTPKSVARTRITSTAEAAPGGVGELRLSRLLALDAGEQGAAHQRIHQRHHGNRGLQVLLYQQVHRRLPRQPMKRPPGSSETRPTPPGGQTPHATDPDHAGPRAKELHDRVLPGVTWRRQRALQRSRSWPWS